MLLHNFNQKMMYNTSRNDSNSSGRKRTCTSQVSHAYHLSVIEIARLRGMQGYDIQLKPASAEHEALDAKTFAEWGVDYMKVDGCGPADYYAKGYAAMGAALYFLNTLPGPTSGWAAK